MNYLSIVIYVFLAVLFGFYLALSRRPKSRAPKVPLGLLFVFFVIKALVPLFNRFGLYSAASSLDVASAVILWMFVVRAIVYLVVDYFIRQKKGVLIPSITRDFGLAVAYTIIAMIVLKHRTDVNLGSLLTTSAILTAVIGFAMQDTLGNLFSGLALQLEHPYQIGDWIGFNEIEGKVVGITWKSTKILTRTEELVFVPNNTIAKSTLKNFSRPSKKHITFLEVGTSYNDPPHRVRKAVKETILNHPKVLKDHEPMVFVTKYNDFSIDYKAFFATDDFASEGRTRFEIMNDLWYKFRRDNIRIPYPIQEEWQVIPSDIKEEEKNRRLLQEEDIFNMLREQDLFRSLASDTVRELARRVLTLDFADGEAIVRQGDPAGPMYIINEGECKVLVSHGADGPAEVAVLRKGDAFGEMSVLTGEPRTATVRANGFVSCYEISKDDMKDIFRADPSVMERMGQMLAKRTAELAGHKDRAEEAVKSAAEKQNQLVSRIRSFFGL